MSPVYMIGVLQPRPEKVKQLKDLFSGLAANVLKYEPGCIQYTVYAQLNGENGVPNLVLQEQYESQAALDRHLQTPYFLEVASSIREGDLLRVPLEMKEVFVVPIAGHAPGRN